MKKLQQHINGYPIEGIWAEGGICSLYLAQNPITHEHLLVKTLSQDHQNDSFLQDRLSHEVLILQKCQHPNIVSLLQHGTYKGRPFLALEFLRGASLKKILAQHPVPLKTALNLLIEICSAVEYLHSLGFAHRDIKPENVFITDQSHAKLIDFGLAAPLDKPNTQVHPAQNHFEGTLFYMSPESIQNSSLSTKARDIYSLGMMAYEMILGRVTHGKVLLAFLPKGLQKIVAKALQPDPNARYLTIEEFKKALQAYLEGTTLEEEHHGSDYFFTIFEQSSTLEKKLLSTLAPREVTDSAFATSCTINRYGMYAATLQDQSERGFFIMECKQKGIEGLLASYLCHYLLDSMKRQPLWERFKSIQETLSRSFPVQCIYGVLNTDLTLQYHTDESMLLLLARKNGAYQPLLYPNKLKNRNLPQPTLEIQDHRNSPGHPQGDGDDLIARDVGEGKTDSSTCLGIESKVALQKEDRLIALGFYPTIQADILQNCLDETEEIPVTQQAEILLQKLRIKRTWLEEEHPVCVLVLIAKMQ